jgi:hypothetical protein
MDKADEFFAWLKPQCEEYWSSVSIHPSVDGRIQPGAKWRSGIQTT